jgi:hypothetical protein
LRINNINLRFTANSNTIIQVTVKRSDGMAFAFVLARISGETRPGTGHKRFDN